MSAAQQLGCVLFRVVEDYTPSDEHKASGCLAIRRGDMLEVKLEADTEQQPKGAYFETINYVCCT